MASGRVIQGFFPHGFPRAAGAAQPRGAATGAAISLPAFPQRGGAPGRPLPPAVQAKMEALFGASFAAVRVHVGAEAAAIGAHAFASGESLYFAPGQYDPQSPRGQRLLAHELTHVVQQRAGRVRNPFGAGVAVVRDHQLETEAERMSVRATAAFRPPAPERPAERPVLQRKALPPQAARRPLPLRPRPHSVPRGGAAGSGATVQPCGAFFSWIASCFKSKPKNPRPRFEDGYDVVPLVSAAESEGDSGWLEDTTCSTSAKRLVSVLKTRDAIGQGKKVATLRIFMNGAGKDSDTGAVIHVKVGISGFSLHEFTIEQRDTTCLMLQAWLDSFSLRQGLQNARQQQIGTLLTALDGLEAALESGSEATIRRELTAVFGVRPSDEEWGKEKGRWVHNVEISWEAFARR